MNRKNIWRKRQLILDPGIVKELFLWHGGQFTAVDSLASTGMEDLVSLSMVEAAVDELEQNKTKKGRNTQLNNLISELVAIQIYWKEHTAKEAGMDIAEKDYEYDRVDYDLSAEDEDRLVEQGPLHRYPTKRRRK